MHNPMLGMSAAAIPLLCVFSLAVPVVVLAVGDDFNKQVEFTETSTVIQTASCIVHQRGLLALYLNQTVHGSSRLLEYLNGNCPTPPCNQRGLRFAASRGSLGEHTSELTLAWEASASLNIDEDELTCTEFFSNHSDQEVSVSVRSFPIQKLRWRMNKTSADLTLKIRLKDSVEGWKLLGGAAGVHVNELMFYSLGTEAGGVTLVKVVNSPHISSITLLHPHSSNLEWMCIMRVGDYERSCGSSAIRNQENQETQEAQEAKDHLLVLRVVVAVLVIVILVLGVAHGVVCRRNKQQDRDSTAGSSRRKDSRTELATPIKEHGMAVGEETSLTIRNIDND